jgi:type VI secretion system secreted protein VgrG
VATKLLNKLSDLKGTASSFLLRSGIKTRSVPQPSSGRGFHMLRFDDTGGSEQFLMRSQGRLDVTALGTRYETIGGDRHLTIGGIDVPHQAAGGNYIAKAYGNYNLHVGDPKGPFNGGTKTEVIEKDYNLDVKRDMLVTSENDLAMTVSGTTSLNASTIVLEASSKITLKVGGNFIVISPAGVSIKGLLVGKNSGGSPDSAPTVVPAPAADPVVADDGTK